MRRVFFALLLSVVFFALAGATKAEHPPEPIQENSKLESAYAALHRMLLSQKFKPEDSKFISDVEFSYHLANKIVDFADSVGEFSGTKGYKNSQKKFYVSILNLTHPVVVQALKYAASRGLGEIVVIADLEDAFSSKKRRAPTPAAKLELSELKDSPAGKAMRELLEDRFDYFGTRFSIEPPPFNNGKDRMRPLFHSKTALFGVEGRASRTIFGWLLDAVPSRLRAKGGVWKVMSALMMPKKDVFQNARIDGDDDDEAWIGSISTGNLVDIPRKNGFYNREFWFKDEPKLIRFVVNRFRALRKGFREGKEFKDIPIERPMRMNYPKTGEWIEIAGTGGRYQLHDTMNDLLQRTIDDPKKYRLEQIIASHYSLANDRFSEVAGEALLKHPEAKMQGIVSAESVDPRGHAVAGSWEGYVLSQNPKLSRKLGNRVADQVDLYVWKEYQQNVIGKVLFHDKTTMVWVVENGQRWCYVFTGSFNLSDHEENEELQLRMKLRPDSRIVLELEASILQQRKINPHLLMSFHEVSLLEGVGNLIGLAPGFIRPQALKQLIRANRRNDFEEFADIAEAVWSHNQEHSKFSKTEMRKRLDQIRTLFGKAKDILNRINGNQTSLIQRLLLVWWRDPMLNLLLNRQMLDLVGVSCITSCISDEANRDHHLEQLIEFHLAKAPKAKGGETIESAELKRFRKEIEQSLKAPRPGACRRLLRWLKTGEQYERPQP